MISLFEKRQFSQISCKKGTLTLRVKSNKTQLNRTTPNLIKKKGVNRDTGYRVVFLEIRRKKPRKN